jgi:hypothetical protein
MPFCVDTTVHKQLRHMPIKTRLRIAKGALLIYIIYLRTAGIRYFYFFNV